MRLPGYDELPDGTSWGLWGPDDVLGCLNLIDAAATLRGVASVRTGEVFPLALEMELPDPPMFQAHTPRRPFTHTVHDLPADTGHDETIDGWNTQSSTQWDGFRHIRSRARGAYYNGVPDEEHGVHHWARKGIVTRGVLADIARHREIRPGEPDPIEPDDVLVTLAAQGTAVEPGDVLLIRTGWIAWYRTLDADARARLATDHANCGLRAGKATARMLWDLHVAAVAADNPSLEVWPPGALATPEQIAAIPTDPDAIVEVFVHTSLLPLLGLPIGELFDLDRIADACARDGRYDFLFTSAPLNLRGGVASPPNALAVR